MRRAVGALVGAITMLGASPVTDGSVGAARPAGEPVTTDITLTSSPNPSMAGVPAIFTATVMSSQGGPVTSGTLEIRTQPFGNLEGSGTPDSLGQFSLALDFPIGTTQVVAIFTGSGPFPPSAVTLNHSVVGAPTQTSLAASPNPAVLGDPVTFTATITASGSPVPGGDVVFYDETAGAGLGTVGVDANGQAALTTTSLAAGSHDIAAFYSGTDLLASSEARVTEQVDEPLATTTTSSTTTTATTPTTAPATTAPPPGLTETSTELTWAPNPPVAGEAVTFTATVTAGGSTQSFGFRAPRGAPGPSGSVTFTDGGSGLGVVDLDASGQASLTTSTLGIGTHVITATYGGSSELAGSVASMTLVV